MPRRPCLICGALTSGSYCPRHSLRASNAREWKRLRAQVIERDGGECQRCGNREQLEAHHVIERAAGGPDAVWNLELVCRPCQQAEHGELGW